ncbi:hypothetical protein RFI_24848 [Reticulomyxa filosa]|uniref:Uncharacterized protein n=1 Tax=Reticulomyxa filosa TaxID=46433 RepID=X6MGI9_RETFI|nr:hypothetical protein RFI_24848 [Reticulomyxa filosa]|eukprot:ETO12527.1 hypothetical protein RFI_24848 [Reticulomyxa filosa]
MISSNKREVKRNYGLIFLQQYIIFKAILGHFYNHERCFFFVTALRKNKKGGKKNKKGSKYIIERAFQMDKMMKKKEDVCDNKSQVGSEGNEKKTKKKRKWMMCIRNIGEIIKAILQMKKKKIDKLNIFFGGICSSKLFNDKSAMFITNKSFFLKTELQRSIHKQSNGKKKSKKIQFGKQKKGCYSKKKCYNVLLGRGDDLEFLKLDYTM